MVRVTISLLFLTLAVLIHFGNSQWRGRADLGLSRKGGRLDLGLERRWRNGNFRAGGFVDTRGNWGASVGLKIRFKRELAKWNGEHFNLVIAANPCFFDVYDTNGDDVITKEDINVVFDDEELANKFFNDLDITTGDGKVDREEFNLMAPFIIRGCEDSRAPKTIEDTKVNNNNNISTL